MTQNTNTNPYYLTQGYEDNHNFAISGYGITVEAIKHWLFDKNLPVTALGYEKATHENVEDALDTDISNYLDDQNPGTSVNYVTTSTAEFTGIMCYSVEPQVSVTTVKSMDQVDADIVQAVEDLYQVPTNLHAELAAFVSQYSGYISVCDFS